MSIFIKYKKIFLALAVLVILVVLANSLITRIVNQKVRDLLATATIENYEVGLKQVRFNLLGRSLLIEDLLLSPTDSAMIALKENRLDKNTLNKISSTTIQLKGISLLPLIFSKNVRVNELIVNDLLYQKFNNGEKRIAEHKESAIRLDSIRIEALSGFELDRLKFKNLKIQLIDLRSGDITFQNDPIDFDLSGFRLEENGQDHFRIAPAKDVFDIADIKVDFTEKKYSFSVEKIAMNFKEGNISINNLAYTPMISKEELAESYSFNKDVFTVAAEAIDLYHFDWKQALEGNGYLLDSIRVSGFTLDIFKDKRKPFDEEKRPVFLHNRLKQMKTPLRIQKITGVQGSFVYEERLENKDVLMKVFMSDMSLQLDNVTSVRTFREEPLKIELKSKLMDKADLQVNYVLPLKDTENTFYFSGSLGPSQLRYYDSAIIPAVGLKILTGNIDKLTFEAQANDQISTGTMTMLYHDMEAEVFKLKKTEKSGFLSWSVNHLIHKSNPGKNGQVRVAAMSAERVEYKGLGNFVWKTVQSGIVNSIAPFGTSPEKAEVKKERRKNKQERKEKRKANS